MLLPTRPTELGHTGARVGCSLKYLLPLQRLLIIAVFLSPILFLLTFPPDSTRRYTQPVLDRLAVNTHTISTILGGKHLGSKPSGLQSLCDNTEWTEGLWLRCHSGCGPQRVSVCGGLNNARNRVQTCIRLAIDAGAGLVLPSVMTRSDENLRNTNKDALDPARFWDMDHLERAMHAQCPQMKIRFSGNITSIQRKVDTPFRLYKEPSHETGTFRKMTREVLTSQNITEISDSDPVEFLWGDTFIAWDYAASNELATVRKDLFKVLDHNPHLLDIGSQVFQTLDRSTPLVAIHLRGESDWVPEFGTADAQMELHTAELERLRNTTSKPMTQIYVSCGSVDAIQTFRSRLEPLGFKIHDKWTLLATQPHLLTQVQSLSFDEKAIVEYVTLVSADYFLGIATSTMSSLVAYARTVNDESEGDFFTTFINPGTRRQGLDRIYGKSPDIKGNERTRLFVINGPDLMDWYP